MRASAVAIVIICLASPVVAQQNQPPVQLSAITSSVLNEGTVWIILLNDYFDDPEDGSDLNYTINSELLSITTNSSGVFLVYDGADSLTGLKVRACDTGGLCIESNEFSLTIENEHETVPDHTHADPLFTTTNFIVMVASVSITLLIVIIIDYRRTK